MSDKIIKYIEENWEKCIRYNPDDDDTLIGMPNPYTVPAINYFNEMYYWDTYFTDKGLEISGKWDLVKNNTDNMLFMVEKFRFMPNGSRTWFLDHSQPPFLSIMVRDVYEHYGDKVWLESAYATLAKEYDFWQTKRAAEIGLNHYDTDLNAPCVDIPTKANDFKRRVNKEYDLPDTQLARHYLSTCESGWDISPRFDYECYNFAAVDLNSLLYALEKNMEFFALELKNGEENLWSQRAENRKNLMYKYMNKDGILLDYNFETGEKSNVFSCASFYPLFVNMVDKNHAESIVKNLYRLEEKFGLAACEKKEVDENYQWHYPMGWACLQYVAVKALDNYGYKEDAYRIAEKYVKLVERVFDDTQNFWEKYNVVEGNINVTRKDSMPIMIGWTAGAYLSLRKYIDKKIV